ncbi:MAG: glutamate formimidoyltransferase [Candidatus Neomarinimicrobiota bacterium]|nr:glutamate formimidoyltransferase [Candidatus Neomarinimicrobiota bacterium]
MSKIVECVPNFSEGQNQGVIDAIGAAIASVEGVALLDVDPGQATNRTVVTFVGSPKAVAEAAFQGIAKATELIDMRNHSGEHARMGATDVCPFVPVRGATLKDCVKIAKSVGERVAEELSIPVFLYESAASTPDRTNLATVRSGEYEGLSEKLKDPQWKPDFGMGEFNPKSGAIAIGARQFLIAYNVNLNTRDRKLATDIALDIREAGRAKRDSDGKIIRDEGGSAVKVPGLLKACKAVGWEIEEYGKAQVSINLTDYTVTPIHAAFEAVREGARKRGLRVTGSELVGLLPLEAMLITGGYYLSSQGKTTGVAESELVYAAVESLGLNDVSPFNPEERIVEYRLANRGVLVSKTVTEFSNDLSSDSPAPGGGSVSALMGVLGAALVSMVAALTHSKKGIEDLRREMEALGGRAQNLRDRLTSLVDEDTDAFNGVMAAFRIKKRTDDEKQARHEAIQAATMGATQVPMEVCRLCLETIKLSQLAVDKGNPNSVSDAAVAAEAALAGLRGARLNVLINLDGIDDKQFCKEMKISADDLMKEGEELHEKISAEVEKVMSKDG